MSNIFKVNKKDTRKTFGASVIKFKQISRFILLLLLLHLKKINAGLACETIDSDNKFVSSNC